MIKGIIAFFVIWAMVAFGIAVFRRMTRRAKFNLVKLIAWSSTTAIVTLGILILIVVTF